MVNLRSREIPDGDAEVASRSRRRASSVQPESSLTRTRRYSVKSEDMELRSSPRSQRKSMRINSPLTLSKTVRKDLFADDSKEGSTTPAPITVDVTEFPEKERGKMNKSVLSDKEKQGSSVKGKEKKISDYFESGKEPAKVPVVRLKDLYASNLAKIESACSKKAASPKKGRRGSLVVEKRTISDFFDSVKQSVELPESEPSKNMVVDDSGESKISPKKGRGKKTSEKSDSGQEDASRKFDLSPSRNTPKNDPKHRKICPRRSTTPGAGKSVVSSGDKDENTEGSNSSNCKRNTPSFHSKEVRSSRKASCGGENVDVEGGEIENPAVAGDSFSKSNSETVRGRSKKASEKSESGQEDSSTKIDISPSRSYTKNDLNQGKLSPRRSTTPRASKNLVSSGDKEENTEVLHSSNLKRNTPSSKSKEVRSSRKDSCGGENADDEGGVIDQPAVTGNSSGKSKPETVRGRSKKASEKSDSGQEDGSTKIDKSPSRSSLKNEPKQGRLSPRRSTLPGAGKTLISSEDKEENTKELLASEPKRNTPSPQNKVGRSSRKASYRGGSVNDEEQLAVSDKSGKHSEPKTVKDLNESQKEEKSSSPLKSRIGRISVTSFDTDDVPTGISSAIISKSPRDSELGHHQLLTDIERSKPDDSLLDSPKLVRNLKASPTKKCVGTPVEKKSDVTEEILFMRTKSNVPAKKRWKWKMSDFVLSQDSSVKDSTTPNVDVTEKVTNSDLKSDSENLSLRSEVRDTVSGQQLKSPMQLVVEKIPLEKECEPLDKGDGNEAARNDGTTQFPFKTPKSTDKKRKDLGADLDSAGMLTCPPKEVVGSQVPLKESTSMEWETPASLVTENEDTSIEMSDVCTGGQTPTKTSRSPRMRRKFGSNRSSTSSDFLVSEIDNENKSHVKESADALVKNNVKDDVESQLNTQQETFDGTKSPKIFKEKKSKIVTKSGSESMQLFQKSNPTNETVSSDEAYNCPEPKSSLAENDTVKAVENILQNQNVLKKRRCRRRKKSGSGDKLGQSKAETVGVSGLQKTDDSAPRDNLDVKTETVVSSKLVPGKAARTKHKKKKKQDTPTIKAPETFEEVRSKDYSMETDDSAPSDNLDVKTEPVVSSKLVPGKAAHTKHKKKKKQDTPTIKAPETFEEVRNKDYSMETDDSAPRDNLDVKTETVVSSKLVPGKAALTKHKKKKKQDTPTIKAPETSEEVRNKDYSMETGDSEVTVRRRGGGTIIESRPVFSDDAKYIYVNCGWGVRVFSIETGECVRVFDASSKDHKVVSCFCWKSCPAALTSEGVFIAWDPRNGKVQHKVRLKVQELVVGGFFFTVGPESMLCLVLETKEVTELRVYSGTTFRNQQHPLNNRKIGHPYNLHHLSVGGNPERPFIAFITNKKKLKIINMENKPFTEKVAAGGNKHWTCVQCHPTEDTVALGDSIGRIVVYRIARSGDRDSNMGLIPSVYHWHTLPVSEIAFTPAGSSMYSGGGELTLVKWNLENPHIKNYLPRLSADIVHIAISPYNQMIAIATLDNGIQIVTPNNKLQCVLQQLSWSVFAGEHEGMFPSGLIYDPRSRGLMLNGRPGHLQLYSPLSETLIYNIDVTMMNYLTQERDKVIVNTHVTHSALTSDGLWLATIETRYEPGLALELKLKFWEYVFDKKRFILATVIDMPHDAKVHSIKFSPGPIESVSNEDVGSDRNVILASTGADKKLRLWAKTRIDYQKGITWRCQNACFYKDRPCGPSSFSYDGSLLAVGFGPVLTLWDVENVVLKQTISRNTDELKFVEFGRDDCCHILLSATETNIVAWNLLTLTLVWKVEMKASLFVPDPYSCFFAVFTTKNQWKIFDARNGEIAYTMNSEGKSEVNNQTTKSQVLAAVFAPRHRPNPDAPKWMRNSYLYYIDIYQELNCLEPANEISQLPTFQLAVDKDAGTPFGSLVSAKSARETAHEEVPKQAVGYGVLGSQAVTQLLRPPAHTLPPVSLLCGSFLQSFIIMKRDAPHSESDHEDKSEDDKTTVVASSDSEDEAKVSTKSGKSPRSRRRKARKPQMNKSEKDGLGEKNGMDNQIVVVDDEPMETDETIDLRKHFPLLDEDDAEGTFIIDD